MITIKSLNKWANAHTYYSLDILRIALGVLFTKGLQFISQSQIFMELFKPLRDFGCIMIVIH
nr:hypothetical protein [Gillisia sp. JM1]